ncbi:hypothetical protein [Microbacterium indicum]|nr:hypothetical protein [Microbacterium indicum]
MTMTPTPPTRRAARGSTPEEPAETPTPEELEEKAAKRATAEIIGR